MTEPTLTSRVNLKPRNSDSYLKSPNTMESTLKFFADAEQAQRRRKTTEDTRVVIEKKDPDLTRLSSASLVKQRSREIELNLGGRKTPPPASPSFRRTVAVSPSIQAKRSLFESDSPLTKSPLPPLSGRMSPLDAYRTLNGAAAAKEEGTGSPKSDIVFVGTQRIVRKTSSSSWGQQTPDKSSSNRQLPPLAPTTTTTTSKGHHHHPHMLDTIQSWRGTIPLIPTCNELVASRMLEQSPFTHSLQSMKLSELSDQLLDFYFPRKDPRGTNEPSVWSLKKEPLGSESDVIVASHPRCGQTAALQMLDMLLLKQRDDSKDSLLERVGFVDTYQGMIAPMQTAVHVNETRLFSSHLPLDFLLRNTKAKVVVVVRDPVHVRESWLHHLKQVFGYFHNDLQKMFPGRTKQLLEWAKDVGDEYESSLEYLVDCLVDGTLDRERVEIVFYEDVLREPTSCMERLSKLVKVDVSNVEMRCMAYQVVDRRVKKSINGTICLSQPSRDAIKLQWKQSELSKHCEGYEDLMKLVKKVPSRGDSLVGFKTPPASTFRGGMKKISSLRTRNSMDSSETQQPLQMLRQRFSRRNSSLGGSSSALSKSQQATKVEVPKEEKKQIAAVPRRRTTTKLSPTRRKLYFIILDEVERSIESDEEEKC